MVYVIASLKSNFVIYNNNFMLIYNEKSDKMVLVINNESKRNK